jgi:hypothetical protein
VYRCGERLYCCHAAGTDEGVAVNPTRLRPAILRLSRCHIEDDNSIHAQKVSSGLLCNVIKPEDVDNPISVGGCAYSPSPLPILISGFSPVEEIFDYACAEYSRILEPIPTLLTCYSTPFIVLPISLLLLSGRMTHRSNLSSSASSSSHCPEPASLAPTGMACDIGHIEQSPRERLQTLHAAGVKVRNFTHEPTPNSCTHASNRRRLAHAQPG